MSNEEQIVQFIEREMTPEQERSLMDQCASSDEMRGMLKQHMALSRHMVAALSSITVSAMAEDRLSDKLTLLRSPQATKAPSIVRRGAIISAVAGLTMLGFLTVAYFAPRPVPLATPVNAPVHEIAAPPATTVPNAPSIIIKTPPVHRHATRRQETTPSIAEKSRNEQGQIAPNAKPKRKIRLTDKDVVH